MIVHAELHLAYSRAMAAFDVLVGRFCSVPGGPPVDWSDVEREVGTALPRDSRKYCDRFPPGRLNSLSVRHPHSGHYPIREAAAWRDRIFRFVREQVRQHPSWPDPDALLPWGDIDATPVFCWNMGSSDDPDQWTSVIFDNGLNITTLELGMVECVSGLVDGSISVPTFVYGRLGDDGPVVFYAEDGSDFPEQG
jgi:hypothetical protein